MTMNPIRRIALAFTLAVLLPWPAAARADDAIDWVSTVDEATAKVSGPRGDRIRAIAWLAAFNALDAIDSRFRAYAPAPAVVAPGTLQPSREAALASALVTALAAEPEADQALLQRKLRETLTTQKAEPEREAGAALGRQAAWMLLLARSGDRLGRVEPESREARAGEFVAPAWAKMPRSITVTRLAPFGIRSVMAFDPGPPPALGSEAALREIAETKSLGAAASTTRTADQTAAALFWNSGEPGDYSALLKPALEAQKLDTLGIARAMALDAMISVDAGIVGGSMKEKYLHWRPESAIAGPLAGEGRDAAWQSLVRAPPSPQYPSGGGVGAGTMEVGLARVFLLGPIEWRNGQTGQLRRWPDAKALGDELAAARVWGGVHFRSAVEAGRLVGRGVASEIIDTQLLPR